MKTYIIVVIFVIIAITLSFMVFKQTKTGKQKLSAVEFADRIGAVPYCSLVDVRTAEEFAQEHLPNATNVDWKKDTFMSEIARFEKSAPIFIYCRSGKRSASAASEMRKEGFTDVFELKDGILGWTKAGYPVQP